MNLPPDIQPPETEHRAMLIVIVLMLIAFLIAVFFIKKARAEEYTDNQIVNAIYKAEGGKKAISPFGILSVTCEGFNSCRRVCFQTVRNNRKRYARYGYKQFKTFEEFLGSRYCPVSAHKLNKNWVRNVRYFLSKGN